MQQFQQFKNLSTWRDKDYTVKGGEVLTIDFTDTDPNQFVIQNSNNSTLYVSISKIPTLNKYEFKVDKNSYGLVGRPTPTKKLYILNGSTEDATIKVFSVFDKFDMNILKQFNASFGNMSISTDGIVRGFQGGVSLPQGNNHIGKVSLEDGIKSVIDNIKADTGNIDSTLSAMKSSLTSNKDNTSEIISILNEINAKEFGGGGDSGSNYDVRKLYVMGDAYNKTPVYLNKVDAFEYTATENGKIHFNYICNDGGDMDITVNDGIVFTMYSGEQVTDFELEVFSGDVVTFVSTTGNYRIKYFTY